MVRATVKLGVAELPVVIRHRGAIRVQPYLLCDQVDQIRTGRPIRAVSESGEHLLSLGGLHELQSADGKPRVPDDGLEQGQVAPSHSRYGRFVEEILAVIDRALEPVASQVQRAGEVEAGGTGIRLEVLHIQAGQCEPFGRRLQYEHHLEQRAVGQATLRAECLHDPLERRGLMRVPGDAHVAHPRKQLAEARLACQVCSQRHRIHEKADQVTRSGGHAVGYRGAHDDVCGSGEPVQEHLEGRQDNHEHAHPLALGEAGERPG